MTIYTYTIFDADPHTNSGTEWPTHKDMEIEADSDQEAADAVGDVMETEASRCRTDDGYKPGQKLYALVWDANRVIVGTPTYTLTGEDLS